MIYISAYVRYIQTRKRSMKKFMYLATVFMSAGLFADGGEGAPAQQSPYLSTFLMLGIAIVFFYFILWRPEQKRRKMAEQRRNSLTKGDKVTAMGIIGIISSVKEDTVIIKMHDGAKLEFLKAAITDVQSNAEDTERK
jgi:preprotein translocase subunit YajC